MNLEEKVSQLFISIVPIDLPYSSFIKDGIGGFMIGHGGKADTQKRKKLEGTTKEDLKSLVDKIKKCRSIPLFTAIDGEGGRVFNRLEKISDYKTPRYYGKKYESNGNLEEFAAEVRKYADLMKHIGFNMNFAPLLDTPLPGYKGYIASEKRSYSDKTKTVTDLGLEAIKTFQSRNIVSVAKHFPGYGPLRKNQNPHKVLPVIKLTKKEFERYMEPFKEAINTGLFAMMKGHVLSFLDKKVPASISAKVENYIRDELGFKGVTMTDGLFMGAIGAYYKKKKITSHRVIEAAKNNDILLICKASPYFDLKNFLVKAVEDGKVPEENINDSVKRILKLKKRIGLIE